MSAKVVFKCCQMYVIEKCPNAWFNLLKFCLYVAFDAEAVLENAKLAILEQIELQIFFTPLSHDRNRLVNFLRKIFNCFAKPKMPSMFVKFM